MSCNTTKEVPVFISAGSSELFVPQKGGRHGAESLWESNPIHNCGFFTV